MCGIQTVIDLNKTAGTDDVDGNSMGPCYALVSTDPMVGTAGDPLWARDVDTTATPKSKLGTRTTTSGIST